MVGGMIRSELVRTVSAALCLAVCLFGCEKAASPPADLSKTPWFDPKVQIEGLKDGDARIRGVSAINLGNIGAPAAEAIPALEKLAQNDPEPKVREQAAKALEKIRAAAGQ
jgi:hypothetical protein